MQALKKPAVLMIGTVLLLAAGASLDWEPANGFRMILMAALSLFAALVLHETGHLIGGLLTKSRFLKMAAGPLLLERRETGELALRLNNNWGEAGGLVLMQLEDPHFRKKILLLNAGGPLFSLLAAGLSFSSLQALQLTGIISLMLFITTSLPYSFGGLFSDGYTIMQTAKNNQTFIRYYKMTNMLLSTKKPETWDLSVQQEAAAEDPARLSGSELSIYLMFLFYTAVLTETPVYLRQFYDKLDLERIRQTSDVQKASLLHYVVASEFLLAREFSVPSAAFKELPVIDRLSNLRTCSIFEKASGRAPDNVRSYAEYLGKASAGGYSFLQVENQFLEQYLVR